MQGLSWWENLSLYALRSFLKYFLTSRIGYRFQDKSAGSQFDAWALVFIYLKQSIIVSLIWLWYILEIVKNSYAFSNAVAKL